MKIYFASILLFLAILQTSCIVVNLTKSKKCPEYCDNQHTLTGKKAIVSTRYGKLIDQTYYSYPYAKRPHSMGCLVPFWPIGRLAKIYVCDSCTMAFKKTNQPSNKNPFQ